jgi:hypothetical protein
MKRCPNSLSLRRFSGLLAVSCFPWGLWAKSLARLNNRNINEAHRQHFEAMDVPLGSVGVAASARPEVLDGLAPYHSALDLPIARLLTDQDATSLPAAAVAAAP